MRLRCAALSGELHDAQLQPVSADDDGDDAEHSWTPSSTSETPPDTPPDTPTQETYSRASHASCSSAQEPTVAGHGRTAT